MLCLVSWRANAQYAPPPGVRDSVLPLLLAPWVLLFLAVVWAKVARNAASASYQRDLLSAVVQTASTFVLFILCLFLFKSVFDGHIYEQIAISLMFLMLFSGPIVLLLSVLFFISKVINRRRSAVARTEHNC